MTRWGLFTLDFLGETLSPGQPFCVLAVGTPFFYLLFKHIEIQCVRTEIPFFFLLQTYNSHSLFNYLSAEGFQFLSFLCT